MGAIKARTLLMVGETRSEVSSSSGRGGGGLRQFDDHNDPVMCDSNVDQVCQCY